MKTALPLFLIVTISMLMACSSSDGNNANFLRVEEKTDEDTLGQSDLIRESTESTIDEIAEIEVVQNSSVEELIPTELAIPIGSPGVTDDPVAITEALGGSEEVITEEGESDEVVSPSIVEIISEPEIVVPGLEMDEDLDGVTVLAGDCDDFNPQVNPMADEICDGIDNDCDSLIDEGIELTWYPDNDGDGFGSLDDKIVGCPDPSSRISYVSIAGDCDDADPFRLPTQIVGTAPVNWTDPTFDTLQSAIDASSIGDCIAVNSGTYNENLVVNTNIEITSLYGSENTILSGGLSGRVVSFGSSFPFSPVVPYGIHGFTIQNGSATEGAGIYAYFLGNISITNNIISSNRVTTDIVGDVVAGSGIYLKYVNNAFINNNIIENNTANTFVGSAYGGGIFAQYGDNFVITGNAITNNTATNYGASLSSSGGGLKLHHVSAIIENNGISNNYSDSGGGITMSPFRDDEIVISNNQIINNSARETGGGLVLSFNDAIMTVSNNFISNNSASVGGGMFLWSMQNNDIIRNNIFIRNHSEQTGSAIESRSTKSLRLYNNLFIANGRYGDSGFENRFVINVKHNAWSTQSEIVNNLFYFNSSPENYPLISQDENHETPLFFTNNIFSNNDQCVFVIPSNSPMSYPFLHAADPAITAFFNNAFLNNTSDLCIDSNASTSDFLAFTNNIFASLTQMEIDSLNLDLENALLEDVYASEEFFQLTSSSELRNAGINDFDNDGVIDWDTLDLTTDIGPHGYGFGEMF